MYIQDKIRMPADLTDAELKKAVHDLLLFNNFTSYEERGVDIASGLTFALEQLACSLGLVGIWLDDSDYYDATMLQEFICRLDEAAKQMYVLGWDSLKASLPYSRALSVD